MLAKYTASGRFSPLLFALLLPAAAVAVALAWVYDFAERWVPLIYFDALIAVGFGIALGYIARTCINMTKCRNAACGGAAGLLISLVGLAAGYYWAYDVAVSGAKVHVSFQQYIHFRVDHGWTIGRSGGAPITGVFVYLVWLIEAAIILGAGVIMGVSAAQEPFCENCRAWADKKVQAFEAPGLSDESIGAIKSASSMDALLTPPMGEITPHPRSLTYDVRICPQCEQVGFLTSKLKTISVDRKGKKQTNTAVLHLNLLLSPEDIEAVKQLEADVRTAADLNANAPAPPPVQPPAVPAPNSSAS